MPSADFFVRLGFFAAKRFLGADWCAALRARLGAAQCRPATLYQSGRENVVDQNVRSTSLLKAPADTLPLVDAKLEALRPALEAHFGLPLRGWEEVKFLRYAKGDYFQAHKDANPNPRAPDYLRARRISIVAFLNGEGPESEADGYGGGSLTFYGLLEDPRWAGYGFSLRGEEGLLVAFRSDVLHEVTPVTHGERFTLVTWFY